MTLWGKILMGTISGVLIARALGASDINRLPPDNWMVPKATGVHTMTDATPPRPFIGLPPCRIVDTRGTAGIPINTGGAFAANETRTWTFTGLCGLPATVQAVSLNITVTGTQSNPFGFLSVGPGGSPVPNVSTLNWNTGGVTESNAAIVPLGTGGNAGMISVKTSNAGAHVIIDTNGYFSNALGSPANYFELDNNSTTSTMVLTNGSGTCVGACGLLAYVSHGTALTGYSATTGDGVYGTSDDGSGAGVHGRVAADVGGSAAVWGEHQSPGGDGSGVRGTHAGSGIGVLGQAFGTTGGGQAGVLGLAYSTAAETAGVFGGAVFPSGRTYGVYGISGSTGGHSAGVRGVDASGNPISLLLGAVTAGVIGDSTTGIGVWGRSRYVGVDGMLFGSAGGFVAEGILGTTFGVAADAATGPWAVFAGGDLGATGVKHFVEPHPAEPNMVILYSSLEGREVGTYFRGSARVSGGRAVIQIPEDFRIVTDDDGLTVQLTPVGAFAEMYVQSQDLYRIVVHASRDVTFHYLVQGVRRAFRDFQPLAKGYEFMPASADARMPAYLTEEAKRRLIANGAYNADGTVNMTTAERAGWTKIWADRDAERDAAVKETREARARSRPNLTRQ